MAITQSSSSENGISEILTILLLLARDFAIYKNELCKILRYYKEILQYLSTSTYGKKIQILVCNSLSDLSRKKILKPFAEIGHIKRAKELYIYYARFNH